MNKKTICEILDKTFDEEPLATLTVVNKTNNITISRHGHPEPVLGNLEEIYSKNKSDIDKTVKVLVELVRDFEKVEKEKYTKK